VRSDSAFDDWSEPAAPAVIGAGDGFGQDDLPEAVSDSVVFVPAHPGVDKGESTVRFELRQMSDGQPAAQAFTSVEKLVEQLGEAQPWLSMHIGRLRVLAQMMGVETVCVDPEVKPGSGRWTEDDLRLFWSE
jgi:hypothetical protein